MRKNSSTHEKIVSKVIQYCKANTLTKGLIALGSIAREDYHLYSDVDLALVINDQKEEKAICEQIERIFEDDIRFRLKLTDPLKIVLYLGDDLLKLDLFVITEISKIAQYFWGSAIVDPKKAILYDRDGDIDQWVQITNPPSEVKGKDEIQKQLELFLYAFEAFSNAHRMSDGYRSYFEFNIALHRLVRIIYLLRGGKDFLFLPRRLVSDYLTKNEQELFTQLNGQIYLRSINNSKRAFLDFFYEVLDEIESIFPELIDRNAIKTYCEIIFQRDFFWNLRDLKKFAPHTIQNNRIYRSAVMSNYIENPFFKNWMKEKGIKTIIDLRTVKEVKIRPYPKDFLKKINYFNIHLFPEISINSEEIEKRKHKDPLSKSYIWALTNRKDQIKRVLTILAKLKYFPIIIHCYGGKDRTGIMSTLIHLIVGTPRNSIIQDYLASDGTSSEEDIEALLNFIEEKGGIETYLNKINISDSVQCSIRDNVQKIS